MSRNAEALLYWKASLRARHGMFGTTLAEELDELDGIRLNTEWPRLRTLAYNASQELRRDPVRILTASGDI